MKRFLPHLAWCIVAASAVAAEYATLPVSRVAAIGQGRRLSTGALPPIDPNAPTCLCPVNKYVVIKFMLCRSSTFSYFPHCVAMG